MSSWTKPVDLRVDDPRLAEIAEQNAKAARAMVRKRLGADCSDVLHALGLEVAA
ncbi:hypothetical protein [Curtobacterium sp. VKM Ac-2884]|uniref:hypothetical protein n=1 Tax=Curtobacterium sp. VKM Ac-2884 TaxID=2783818 RepID=UPI00188AED11|nr:hypothetical protein [Curtobacterium sp. VKM Ac-2884]MBF4602795.1 hypothetical protein [Curtobacterium sp. VKM Ac-2884]